MATSTRCCFRSRTATCVCAFVIIHVILAVTLVSALFTRFYVYRTWTHSDMPSDMRIMDREVPGIFCSDHIIRSSLVDIATSEIKRGQDELASNSVPEFDVYTSQINPTDYPKTTRFYSFNGQGAILQKQYTHHHFQFLKGTDFKVSLCTHYVDEDMIRWHVIKPTAVPPIVALKIYLIRGDGLFDDMKQAIVNNNTDVLCEEKEDCHSMDIPPSANCNTSSLSTLQARINATDDYFLLIYNPVTEFHGQQYRIFYKLNRVEYNLSSFKPAEYFTRKFVANDKYLLLYFNYTRDEPSNHLYNIQVDYICETNVMMYMSIFFFIPLVIIIGFGSIVMCCYERRRDQYGILDHHSVDRNEATIDDASGYGSTHAIYT